MPSAGSASKPPKEPPASSASPARSPRIANPIPKTCNILRKAYSESRGYRDYSVNYHLATMTELESGPPSNSTSRPLFTLVDCRAHLL